MCGCGSKRLGRLKFAATELACRLTGIPREAVLGPRRVVWMVSMAWAREGLYLRLPGTWAGLPEPLRWVLRAMGVRNVNRLPGCGCCIEFKRAWNRVRWWLRSIR